MKKIIVLSVLMLLLMGVNSFATDTRVLTMGENSTVLLDDANIWLYPSRINHYPNILTAEMSSIEYYYYPSKADWGGDQPISKIGINWKFGGDKPWILGTYLHNNAVYMDENNLLGTVTPSTSIIPWHGPYWYDSEGSYSNKRVDLFWGTMFGENAFGIHIGYVHSSNKNDDTEPDDGIYLNERGFGKYDFQLGLTMMENKLDLAAGIELFSFTYKNTYYYTTPDTSMGNYDRYKPEGNSTMFIRGRYFYEYSPTYTFVPHAEFKIGKYEYTSNLWSHAQDTDSLLYTDKYNLTSFDLGVGMQYTPATKVLAVIDVGFMYAGLKEEYTQENVDPTETDEEKWNYTVLPYFKVGLEAEVFSWMDLRMGAISYWTMYKNEEDTYINDTLTVNTTYKEKYPYNHTYLGLGFHWNRLHVDTYVDPELFMDGFYFLSGVDSKVAGMNFQISAKYDMF
ncbi:MAG: hypothetical protein JXA92_04615 [candidate division Zixibacteria bacterium]|nr:hypothetical protein [candidate division Zixibacteria bacterium]